MRGGWETWRIWCWGLLPCALQNRFRMRDCIPPAAGNVRQLFPLGGSLHPKYISSSWSSLSLLEVKTTAFLTLVGHSSTGPSWPQNSPEVKWSTVLSHSSPTSLSLWRTLPAPFFQGLYSLIDFLHVVFCLRIWLLGNTNFNIQCPRAVTWGDLPWRIKYYSKKAMDGGLEDRDVAKK